VDVSPPHESATHAPKYAHFVARYQKDDHFQPIATLRKIASAPRFLVA
jgi:hypothetical protein